MSKQTIKKIKLDEFEIQFEIIEYLEIPYYKIFHRYNNSYYCATLPKKIIRDFIGFIDISGLSDREKVLMCIAGTNVKKHFDEKIKKQKEMYEKIISELKNKNGDF